MSTLFSSAISQLINALRGLPTIGPKSAQRMAFYILSKDKMAGLKLADALQNAIDHIKHCHLCRTLTENSLCSICKDSQRDSSLLCIVESPSDIIAIEQTESYNGLYFVLMGHLSPLDGIGPEEIGINHLLQRLKTTSFKEIILATNSTIEGEATAFYLANLIKSYSTPVTRLAHGVPLGGELEFVNTSTLSQALIRRRNFDEF